VTREKAKQKVRPIAGPSAQGWVLPHLVAWVDKQGCDAAAIQRLPGLADLKDPDIRVPEASVETAWRLAMTMTGNAGIGVHLAESLPRGALDLVEYAFRSSASLGAGLERLARYGRVLSDRVAARMEARGEGLLLLVRDTGATALQPGRAEFALAVALKFARESVGADITPLQVSFAHAAPEDASEHRRFFRGPVRFGVGANSMTLSAVDAARSLQAADEALAAIVHRRLDKVLAERDLQGRGPLSGRVRRMMVEHLGETTLTPETVARALAVSRRTLSRHLADEGMSFRDILDDVRPGIRKRLAAGSQLERRRRGVFPRVLRARGVQPIIPALDRSDATGVQVRMSDRDPTAAATADTTSCDANAPPRGLASTRPSES
jgi:AraC-like DNA-binding protein